MERKLTIIVAEGCPHCEEIKKIESDSVEVIDASSEKAKELTGHADKFNIPLAFDEEGNTCEISISKEDNTVSISCANSVLIKNEKETVIIDYEDESINKVSNEDVVLADEVKSENDEIKSEVSS